MAPASVAGGAPGGTDTRAPPAETDTEPAPDSTDAPAPSTTDDSQVDEPEAPRTDEHTRAQDDPGGARADESPEVPPEDPPARTVGEDALEHRQPGADESVEIPSKRSKPIEPSEETEPTDLDLADPLGPIQAALDDLEAQGVAIRDRREVTDPLRGSALTATLQSTHFDLVAYVLRRTALTGYQIMLQPVAPDTVDMIARPTRAQQARGVVFVQLQRTKLQGDFLESEETDRIGRIVAVPDDRNVLWPGDVATNLRAIGYKASFRPSGAGTLDVEVSPGRLIRRVRVRGYIPLDKREVRRELSLEARPGALARGRCVPRKRLRDQPRPPPCAKNDLACQAWVDNERERIERYLFDQGYLQGTVSFGLSCGRAIDETDLWVFLDKGPPYRIPRRNIRVTGNVSSRDARWIKRIFRPTISPFLPLPKRVTRTHIEDAKDTVEREYAEPSTGGFGAGSRKELQYPYPGVRVTTSYDEIDPENPPKDSKLELEVNVQLGQGVKTSFLGNDAVSKKRLLQQIQLFKRKEPVTEAAATREAENLRNFYQIRGFMLATVRGRAPDFGNAGLQQLMFVIKEGPRGRIRDLELHKPPSVPGSVFDDIRSSFNRDRKLKQLSRFVDGEARKDLQTLLNAYRDAGYPCARPYLRVAFWEDGVDEEGAHATLTLQSEQSTPGQPTWLQQQLDPQGLAALRGERRIGVYVHFGVRPGPRVMTSGKEIVRHLEEPIPPSRTVEGLPTTPRGAWGAPRMLRDGPLRREGDERASGIAVRPTLARDAERHIEQLYHSSGYPVANSAVRWVYVDEQGERHPVNTADRLALDEVGLCREHADDPIATVDTELNVYEGQRGQFGSTFIRGNFKTRDWVIEREIDWEQGKPYDQRRVDQTVRHIEGTGVAEMVTAQARPVGCHLGDVTPGGCKVHEVITMTEAKDYSVRPHFGLGGATLDPFYVFVRPVFPNMWGTAWDLTIDGHWGFNPPGLRELVCDGEDCYQRSARTTLVRQRIWASPLTFSIGGSIQQRVTPARGQIDSALGEVRLTWPIDENWQIYGSYLFQIANISKDLVKPIVSTERGCGPEGEKPCNVVDRGEAIVPDRTGAFQTGVSWQRVDNPFNPNDGFMASADFLLASPWLGGWDWWFRADLTWQHFVPIPRTNDRFSIRYSLRYGHAVPIPQGPGAQTTAIPEVWRYFAGGTVDLGLRGIEPQTMLVDIERIENQFGVTRLNPRAVGGHIRALGTLAFQVVSIRNLFSGRLSHSLFFDFGILTQRWKHVKFNRDFRRSVGINFVKWDIDIVTLALGYAVLIPDFIWPGNVRPTDDHNGRFIFNVGVTF